MVLFKLTITGLTLVIIVCHDQNHALLDFSADRQEMYSVQTFQNVKKDVNNAHAIENNKKTASNQMWT